MAKLTGPLLSFGSRGQIGKTLVTSKWRGVPYARQYVTPANPRTTAQQENRTRFAFLREAWKLAPADVRLPWDTFALGRPFLGLNKFVGENNRLLVGQSDLSTMIMSPGARGGLPPVSFAAVAGAATGSISATIVPPAQLPDQWTITQWVAVAIPEQDPVGIFEGPFVAGAQALAATPVVLTGLGAGTVCRVFGFIEYENQQGLKAFSVSLSAPATAKV